MGWLRLAKNELEGDDWDKTGPDSSEQVETGRVFVEIISDNTKIIKY